MSQFFFWQQYVNVASRVKKKMISCGILLSSNITQGGIMDYIESIQKSIDYIETNLGEKLTLQEISDFVYISPYHFSRIFKAIIGVTVHEYIRRRRLSEGAKKLINTDRKILDIAIKFGFESQESFSKSFKQYFASTPMKFRKLKPQIWFYEKGELYLANLEIKNLKGGTSMEYKIVEKNEIKLVGLQERIIMPNNTIPQLWERFMEKSSEIKDGVKTAWYGVADNMASETYEFDETVALEVPNFDNVPEGMTTKVIAPQKYLVFTYKGKIMCDDGEPKLQKTYDYIYGKLLPSTEFLVDKSFNFELYDERFQPGSDDSEFDIYVPIK